MTEISGLLGRAESAIALAAFTAILAVAGIAAGTSAAAVSDRQYTVQSKPAALRGALMDTRAEAQADAPQQPIPADALVAEPSATELAMVRIAAEQRCLAEAMYYEARGEGAQGEEAIAEVIFHRMSWRGYPASICGVVHQSDNSGCQFSFVCNGEMSHPKSPGAWAHASLLAARILSGYMPLGDATGGATSFHALDVEPDWSASLKRTVQIGNHVFYKPMPRTRPS